MPTRSMSLWQSSRKSLLHRATACTWPPPMPSACFKSNMGLRAGHDVSNREEAFRVGLDAQTAAGSLARRFVYHHDHVSRPRSRNRQPPRPRLGSVHGHQETQPIVVVVGIVDVDLDELLLGRDRGTWSLRWSIGAMVTNFWGPVLSSKRAG